MTVRGDVWQNTVHNGVIIPYNKEKYKTLDKKITKNGKLFLKLQIKLTKGQGMVYNTHKRNDAVGMGRGSLWRRLCACKGASMSNIFDLFKKIEKGNATPTGPVTHIVVGLGNPGSEYAATRHNAGFLAVDRFAERLNTRVDRARFRAITGEATWAGKHVLLMKPQTFMNLSGEAVREAAAFYKIPAENVIVISDDVNFDVGRIRIRAKGSDGGHNGIKNIIYQLQSDQFPRVRLGVGVKPHPDYDLADWVLSPFSKEDMATLTASFDRIFEGIGMILQGDVPGAMQACNGK